MSLNSTDWTFKNKFKVFVLHLSKFNLALYLVVEKIPLLLEPNRLFTLNHKLIVKCLKPNSKFGVRSRLFFCHVKLQVITIHISAPLLPPAVDTTQFILNGKLASCQNTLYVINKIHQDDKHLTRSD